MKEWNLENWKKLIGFLLNQNYSVIITGAPSDFEKSESLTHEFKNWEHGKVYNFAGRYSLAETVSLINKVRLVILLIPELLILQQR